MDRVHQAPGARLLERGDQGRDAHRSAVADYEGVEGDGARLASSVFRDRPVSIGDLVHDGAAPAGEGRA